MEFQVTKLQENLYLNFGGIFVLARITLMSCKIWWFFLTEKAYPCANCPKNHRLERAQCAFSDQSKTLVFSDVIKIEILFKYSRALATRTYSSRAKKSYPEPPELRSCLSHWTVFFSRMERKDSIKIFPEIAFKIIVIHFCGIFVRSLVTALENRRPVADTSV